MKIVLSLNLEPDEFECGTHQRVLGLSVHDPHIIQGETRIGAPYEMMLTEEFLNDFSAIQLIELIQKNAKLVVEELPRTEVG